MYKKLNKLRLKKGYSGLYIAKQLGISKVYYHQIESGKRRLSYDNAVKIASIFKMKPDEIFYDDHLKKD